jgi:hypothetical protein
MDVGGANVLLTIHAHVEPSSRNYADTIRVHRLRFPHNKSAIILVDVLTSTFHTVARSYGES